MEKSVYKYKIKNSRTFKSLRNITFGIGSQIIVIIMGFITRAFFLEYLNESYLGINSLFTEMLSMLSLADLGINTVMVYSLYEPLAQHDEKKITALISFYKIIYRAIAAVIAIAGIVFIPFLNCVVKLDETISFLYIYYFLFLLRTVGSYLFVYKVSILTADQNNYIVNYITSSVNIFTTILQIATLILTHSYLLYLILNVISIWVINFLCAKKAVKIYPFITSSETLPLEEKRKIFQNIRSGFLYKISSIMLNSTDNIIISTILGTVVVGYYSNYGLVINKFSAIINIAFTSITSSIGNLIATENSQKRYQIFSIIQTLSFFIGGISCVCIFILVDEFISLWIGKNYILGKDVLIACMINFYLSITLQPLWAFREATGLYQKTKNIMLCTAGLNIVLSIFMAYWFGLAGVILASAISRLLTYFWYEPILLFAQYFNQKVQKYFIKHLYNVVIIIFIIFFETKIINDISCGTWLNFISRCVLIFSITLLAFIAAYCWKKDFRIVINYMLDWLKKV